MSSLEQLGLLVGMMVVTFGVRYPVLALSGKVRFPRWLRLALQYVPVAVLSALSAPIIVMPDGVLSISMANEYLVAGVFAIIVAALSRHLLLTICSGMTLFLMLRFFL